jgi:hypothetical protein
MLLALASAVFLRFKPLGLATIFYSLRSETSLFVVSYNSLGHGGGIQPCLDMGMNALFQVQVTLQLTVSQSVFLGVELV